MENNPYSTPQSDLVNDSQTGQTNTSGIWSISGRIGRVQYAAYGFITFFLISLAGGLLSIVFTAASTMAGLAINFLMQIPILFYFGILAKRRLNDIGHSSWLSLMFLVPFVGMLGAPLLGRFSFSPDGGLTRYWVIIIALSSLVSFVLLLYLIIRRGDAMPNQYGLPPAKVKTWMYLAALTIPVVSIIGILTAIVIPAYQDYTERAKSAQVELSEQP